MELSERERLEQDIEHLEEVLKDCKDRLSDLDNKQS